MMDKYKDYKIKRQFLWLFSVLELERETLKPNKIVTKKRLFTGSILSCEAYIRLLNYLIK